MFGEDRDGDTGFCRRILKPLTGVTAQLARVGKSGRFVRVPGAGHEIYVSRPDAVNKAVDEVLATARAR